MVLRPAEILLVEDSADDVELTKEALIEINMKNNLHVARDGEQALAFLNKENEFKDAPTPDLILLDLNLPRMDGKEVLENIKQAEVLKRIPVIVLTTSESDEDKLKAYDLHANCYIAKPLSFDGFVEVVKEIKSFWFSIVKLPVS